MKLWKRWTAAVLAAAMALLLLVACGPSGPSAPDAPDKPGSSEPGKDPTDPGTGEPGKDPSEENTGEQKKAAVVDTLNAVRKDYGNKTQLVMDAEVCAMAEKMAKLQLDSLLGVYGNESDDERAVHEGLERHQQAAGKGQKAGGRRRLRCVPHRNCHPRLGKGHRQMETGTGHEHGSHPCGRGRCAEHRPQNEG